MKKYILLLILLFLAATSHADLTMTAGEGVDLAGSAGVSVTISGEDASDSNKGIATFNTANFSASSGDITIKDGGVADEELANEDFGDFTCTAVDDGCTLDNDTIAVAEFLGSQDWGDMSTAADGTVSLDTNSVTDNEIDYTAVTCTDLTMTDCGAIAGSSLDISGQIQAGSGNHDLTNATGLIDGEKVQDDTIDDDSIDFSDVTCADITVTDCGALTSSGTITAAVGFDCEGDVDCDIGSADIDDITFITDSVGADDSNIVLPDNSVGDAEIDWSGLTASHTFTSPGITITTGNALTFGATRIDNGSDKVDGEQIADDTIDDDSIDFGDVTMADFVNNQIFSAATTFDAGAVSDFEIENSEDPDVDTAGEISFDTDDNAIRCYDGSDQVVCGAKEVIINITITEPNDLDETSTLVVWQNRTNFTFTINEIHSYTDADDVNYTLLEINDPVNFGDTSTIQAVTVDTNGTDDSVYYDNTTGLDIDIEATHSITFDNDASDTPDYISIAIVGFLDADVD